MNTPTEARIWDEDSATHIDVRGLPPPQPMVEILGLLRGLPRSAVVIVHHERDPVWLYPELVQIGWWADVVAGTPGEVRLRLTASGAAP
ncbi:MAG: DUF2249 domain-containing protein [Rubrivivax sp.]|nr:DUF2249 domain-containing protein [Rubrivivax sp.]